MIKEFLGGKEVIDRLQKAYGFSKRKEFGDYLGIPSNTFSTWVKRNHFPADLVAKCAIETGARLQYLAYGEEPIFDNLADLKYFHTIKLDNGKSFIMDNKPFLLNYFPYLNSREDFDKIFCVIEDKHTYFCINEFDLVDGEYFVVVENSHLIRYITVLPQGKIRVDGGKFSFEANVDDVQIAGRVILKMEKS
ncbi:bacteriophage CI repressor-like protein [Volucribacter psittacicida]|uniref:Bacteriophage CI repressor-like protein n=1 Tax=Volucribacter psittacicida TaxID=203482 RepID=A0A4R1FU13_9PAST|nr:phage repressor protein CI [Volucribacter psittacicida]TCJ98806.1 bacteriophage CI repressor-like protein [Volucribacter psittacicida]